VLSDSHESLDCSSDVCISVKLVLIQVSSGVMTLVVSTLYRNISSLPRNIPTTIDHVRRRIWVKVNSKNMHGEEIKSF
jgi:hypothetical protein